MKKFKMAVGTCGPRILYTNIIRANSPEEAARMYLGYEGTEEDIAKVAPRMFEVEERAARKEDDHFVDALGAEIEIGQDVVFICRQDKNALRKGKVHSSTKSTIMVKSDNKLYRLVSDPEDGLSIKKAIVIDWKKDRAKKDSCTDGIGQPIKEGKTVAYRQELYVGNCKGFLYGTVIKITATYVFIRDIETEKDIRRRHDLVVVINHTFNHT